VWRHADLPDALLETWGERCGIPCDGTLKETKECDQTKAADCEKVEDCDYEEWSKWSKCSKTCGGGMKERSRGLTNDAMNGGKGCDQSLKEVEPCNAECCPDTGPVDCKYEEWGEWGACSRTCEGGHRTRSREVKDYPLHGGKLCEAANLEELEACEEHTCDTSKVIDGKWDPWEEWGECSQTCGGGYRSRARSMHNQAVNGGKPATGPYSEWEQCNEQGCGDDAVDCEMSDWSAWQGCSCKCTGIQKAVRKIVKHGAAGGKVCEGGLQKVQPCNLPGSPGAECATTENFECQWKPWTEWSECSAKCLGGIQVRKRSFPGEVPHPDAHGVTLPTASTGVCEGPVEELRACATWQCYLVGTPVDCAWEEWGDWSVCSVSCGQGGEKARYRLIKTHPKFGGKACNGESSVEVTSCEQAPCVKTRYCNWSEWEPWGTCSVSCGGGQMTRHKTLAVHVHKDGETLVNSASENLIELQKGVDELRMQRKTRTAGLAAATTLGVLAVALLARGRSSQQSFQLIQSAD
jgi:hypothetical protein